MTKLLSVALVCGICLFSWQLQAAEKFINLPPASLENWYKPANKRQVWLHTMFNLRRELQAINQYSDAKDPEHLKKWSEKFIKHYLSIGEMVPEWSDELDLVQIKRLEQAVLENNHATVSAAVRKLKQTCKSCHGEYRALVAATYRVPDFSGIEISTNEKNADFSRFMEGLSVSINQIKIASDDGFYSEALSAFSRLNKDLTALGGICQQCHRDDPEAKERFLGSRTTAAMDALQAGLETQSKTESGRALGRVAVYSCARCHSVHRSLYDLKAFIE